MTFLVQIRLMDPPGLSEFSQLRPEDSDSESRDSNRAAPG